MRLAIYNFGQFRLPSEDPSNDGFHARNDLNFATAEASAGFIARSGYPDEPGPESWGEHVYPRFYVERGDGWAPSTLSLWRDLPSLMAFAYAGILAEAMRNARAWFVEPEWPPYVLWWVDPDHRPDWAEGVARLENLHDRGPGPDAFGFKTAFGPDGRPASIDSDAVRRLVAGNRARHPA